MVNQMDDANGTNERNNAMKTWNSGDVFEISYFVPGRDGWRRRIFRSEVEMEAFVDALREREGDDVEVRYGEGR